jgi:hypothetical protein
VDELSTKYRIYSYAINGYNQGKIVQFIHVSPAYVCKIIHQLKNDGCLKEVYDKIITNGKTIYKKTKPILYEATDKIYPIFDKLTPPNV